MQNAYVGDIGDFGKFALLDHLVSSTRLRIGVIWHFVEPELGAPHNRVAKDGRHREYLCTDHGKVDPHHVRACNGPLYRSFVERGFYSPHGHDLSMLEQLYPDYSYFRDHCHRHAMSAFLTRSDWIERALARVAEADIVFFDPDNGITFDKSNDLRKHVHIDELKSFWREGKSLVIYHHLGRINHEKQTAELSERLAAKMETEDVHSLRFRRGTGRAYFILPQPRHREAIGRSIARGRSDLEPLLFTLADWRVEIRKRRTSP